MESQEAGAPAGIGLDRPEGLKDRILELADDMKAQDISALFVGDRTSLADWLVFCSGTSDVHCRAIADNIHLELKGLGHMPVHPPDRGSPAWTLLDYGSVIVHVLSREARDRYRLESFWKGGG